MISPIATSAAAPVPLPEALPPERQIGAEATPTRDSGLVEVRFRQAELRRKTEKPESSELPAKAGPITKVEAPAVDRTLPEAKSPDPKTPIPAPSPAAPPSLSEREPIRAEWGATLAPTRARDFEAALVALRKLPSSSPDTAQDLELLRQAATLHREALQVLSRIPRGQALVLDVREDAGRTRRMEGTFLRADAGRVLLRAESKVEEVEVGEILPSSWARLLEAGGRAPAPATCAVCSLLEGETEAARKLLGDRQAGVPQRYWGYARQISEADLHPDPLRELYAQALRDLGSLDTASRGACTMQALLRDHANDPFVLRNKASFADRAQGGRDFLLLAEDLRAVGALRAAKGGKTEMFWTSEGEPDPAKPRENCLEVVFSTVPDALYKCWILAGGCCLETFEFSCQGSELLGPPVKGTREPAAPGSPVSLPLRPWISGLKKTHAAHTGPRHAARWEWIPVSLPKYATAGTQELRIIFEQKGFSVGGVSISAIRTGPPSESDLKEWIRSRGERPRVDVVQPPKVIPLVRCLFDGTDRRLVGTLEKGSLSGVTLYGKCFAGLERSEPLTVPPQGELRATYYLQTATTLHFRLRIERSPSGTVAHDVVLEKPAVGVPTEIRIPFTQFRALNQPGTPAVAPGDRTTMIYIFGDAVDCGLRLDALSLVEIRAPEGRGNPVRTSLDVQQRGAAGDPWKPIFDGRSLRGFVTGIEDAWHVQDGRFVHDNPVDNAAQTQEEFGDGDIRFRFEIKAVRSLWVAVRQDGKGGSFCIRLEGSEIAALQGGEHELLFSCRGDKVTAVFDGKARPVEGAGNPRTGRIQFNSFDGSFRIRSLEYRESR
jgi:hypothetical protein